MDEQQGLEFDGPPRDGLAAWRRQRQAQLDALGRRIGLPLGHEVEIELSGAAILRGRLEVTELVTPADGDAKALAALELRVDRCVFRRGEIERCVRLD